MLIADKNNNSQGSNKGMDLKKKHCFNEISIIYSNAQVDL